VDFVGSTGIGWAFLSSQYFQHHFGFELSCVFALFSCHSFAPSSGLKFTLSSLSSFWDALHSQGDLIQDFVVLTARLCFGDHFFGDSLVAPSFQAVNQLQQKFNDVVDDLLQA
jgi:hypothetical protein